MEPGTKLKAGVLYYTKDGRGNVITFNMGPDFRNDKPALMTPNKTETEDVWGCGIARRITDIEETPEAAKLIKY